MRRPSILIGVIAILLVAAPARAADRFVGVSAGTLFAADGTLQPGTGPALEALARSGIAVARVDARWDSVEPFGTGIVYPRRWAPTDRIAATLAGRGVHWLPVLGYATEWSTSVPGTDKAAPLDTEAFARYAAGIVARYGPDGDFWRMHPELPQLPVSAVEVWNEPNVAAYWRPAPDPAAYADLYLRAQRGARGEHGGDGDHRGPQRVRRPGRLRAGHDRGPAGTAGQHGRDRAASLRGRRGRGHRRGGRAA
jgi:hypothetical protein